MSEDPTTDDDLPATQAMQETELEYQPAAQVKHSIEPGTQDMQLELLSAEYFPATQDVHVVDEVAAAVPEKVPATQDMQLELPSSEYFPASQDVHVVDDVAASSAENVPALQDVQLELLAVEYCPAPQDETQPA